MSAHTPGPWRANSSWIEGPQMALRVAAVDWPVRGSAPKSKDEAKANARLIAAAPEMLEALKACADKLASLGWSQEEIAARAAIAKATGGEQ